MLRRGDISQKGIMIMTKVNDILLKSQLFGGLSEDHLEEIKKYRLINSSTRAR